ncbi:MAG: GNAT family N-acetyltransferase [Planctomycetota bacterium]
MPTKSRITRALPRIMAVDSESRIHELRRQRVAPFSEPENLDLPLDRDIEVRQQNPQAAGIYLRVGDQDVSWAWVQHYHQQIGQKTVRMGGVAGVGTHADHRFKGYSRRVLINTLRWMRQNGYGVSMLFGVPSFYPKFGFAPAFPDTSWSLHLRDAERLPARVSGLKWSPYCEDYLASVLALYQRQNLNRTGVVAREAKTWMAWRHGLGWGNKAVVYVGLDVQKKVQAYIAYDDRHLTTTVLEIGCRSAEFYADLIQHAAEHALAQRLEKIRFELPPDSRLMEFCKVVGVERSETFRPDAAAMVRLIDLPVAFVSVAQELASRMTGVPAGSLAIKTNLDQIGVRWGDGRLEVIAPPETAPWVKLPQWALAQLYFGYHRPETLYALGVLTGSVEGVELLNALFPQRPHYFYKVDEF